MGLPSSSTQALIAARELLEPEPELLFLLLVSAVMIAVVRLYVQRAASMDMTTETAPPLDVLRAAGIVYSVTGALQPWPLTGASLTPPVALAKDALCEAGLCAN